jgi:hypothetical protein
MPYLAGKSTKPAGPGSAKAKYAAVFKCPSDREPRGDELPRSYAMTTYDINRAMWPADGNSLGGIGIVTGWQDAPVGKKSLADGGGRLRSCHQGFTCAGTGGHGPASGAYKHLEPVGFAKGSLCGVKLRSNSRPRLLRQKIFMVEK